MPSRKLPPNPLFPLMRALDTEYQRLWQQHQDLQPRNAIPVGGGDWMDTFFRTEAIRGMLTSLRHGDMLAKARQNGKAVCEIAIQLWNGEREWQVHRSKCWIEDYLISVLVKCGVSRKVAYA